MSSIPQKKTAFGEISINTNEMNQRSPSRKTLIPGGSIRKTNIPDNKASIQLKKNKVESSVSRLGAAVDKSSVPGLQVAVRVRPLNSSEKQRGKVWKALNKFSSITQTTRDGEPLVKSERVTGKTFFTYDKSFGETTSTDMVYESVAKGIVNSVVAGVNGTVFAYGQTSSGKTYTMQGAGSIADGAKPGSGGIIHMAAKDIFRQIAMTRDRNFVVKTSFLEIYNEEIRDLLSEDEKTLSIRENGQKGVFVECTEETVLDAKGFFDVIHRGEQARTVAATAMNERSSRSHAIIRITVESTSRFEDKENSSTGLEYDTIRRSTLNLVDLAGSESVRLTGATADRQKEGGMINQSLLALSRVVSALGSSNQSFVNFRDSKLTRILQSTLSGNSRISFICCITPSEGCLEETRSTLQFASRAKRVKVQAEVNEVVNDSATIERLQRQLTSVQQEAKKNESENRQKLAKALLDSKNAQSDAKRARVKNEKFQKLIAASEHFFGGPADSSRASTKRRLSEADVIGTPCKTMNELSEPKSDSRLYKQSRTNGKCSSRELEFLMATLRAKDQRSEEKNSKLSDIMAVLQSTDYELKEALGDNELLGSQDERSKLEMSWLSSEIKVLKSELASQGEALKRKESSLRNVTASWQSELSHRNAIEQDVKRLTSETEDLKEQLDNVKSILEAEKSSFEESLAQVKFQTKVQEEEKKGIETELLQKKEELKETSFRLSMSDEQLKRFRCILFNAGFERDQLLYRQQQSSLLISELRDSVLEHESNLHHMVAALRAVREELCEQGDRNQMLEDQVVALEESEVFLRSELSKQKLELEQAFLENSRLEEELSSSTDKLSILQERMLQQDHLIEEMNQKVKNYDEVLSNYNEASMSLVEVEETVTRIKGELDAQASKCMLLETDMQEARALENDLRKSVEDKSQQLNDLEGRMTLIQKEIKEKDEQLRDLRDVNANLKESAIQSNVTIADMEQKIADAEIRRVSQETTLCELRNIEKELRAELERKTSQYMELVSKCGSDEKDMQEALLMLDEMEIQYATLKSEVVEKEEQLGTLKIENASLNNDLDRHSTTVAELRHAEASLKEELKSILVKLDDMKSRYEEMQNDQEGNETLIAELQSQCELQENSASEKEGRIVMLESHLSEASANLEIVQQEFANAKALEEQLRRELQERNNLVEDLRKRGELAESELLEKKKVLAEMEESVDKSKSENIHLEEMIQNCNKRCLDLETLVSDQASLIADLQSQRELQEKSASEKEGRIAMLESHLSEASANLELVQQEFANAKALEEQLRRELQERNNLVEDLRKRGELAESELLEKKKALAEMEESVDKSKSENIHLEEMIQNCNKLEALVKDQASTITDLQSQRELQEKSASEKEGRIAMLESHLSEASANLELVQQEFANAKALEEQLRSELQERNNLVEDLRKRGELAESELLEKEKALAEMEESVNKIKSENIHLEEMIQNCNKRCLDLETLVSDQASKIEMQIIIQKEQGSALEEKTEEIKELQGIVEERTRALDEAEEEMRMLNGQQNMQIQQIMQLETELDEAQEREKDVLQQLDALQNSQAETESQSGSEGSIAELTGSSAAHSVSFTPFPPTQEVGEMVSIVSGIKCYEEVSTWTCRLCKKEDSSIHDLLSEKDFAFDWLRQRDASASQLRTLAIDHAEKEGHELLWNFTKKDNIEDQISYFRRGALGARWSLLQSADISSFEEFQNDVAWPPKSPSDLIGYNVKRFARAEGVLLQASAHMFKKINGGKAVAKGDNQVIRDDCRAALQLHYQAILRAIERNWTTIQTLSSQEVFVRIQDILIGGHYEQTVLYVPNDEDSKELFL